MVLSDLPPAAHALRLVVTATPYGRLDWTADVLRRLGIACGHEQVFCAEPPAVATVDAEASWMAAPYFARLSNPLRVLQYRNLDEVVADLVEADFFAADTTARRFALAHSPEAWRSEPCSVSVRKWVAHWRALGARRAQVMWSVERLSPARLAAVLSRAGWERSPDQIEAAMAQTNAGSA